MKLFRKPDKAVLLVCTANICRSPMAEGILRSELRQRGLHDKVWLDSAGTHATQPGRAPDPRASDLCQQYGIDIRKFRARQVGRKDFERFDYILAMDSSNYEWLVRECPPTHRHKIFMLASWASGSGPIDIPDPYFGNQKGFVHVFELLQLSVGALVKSGLID